MGINALEAPNHPRTDTGFYPHQQDRLIAALLTTHDDEQRAILLRPPFPAAESQKEQLFQLIGSPDWSDGDVIPILEKVLPKYPQQGAGDVEIWGKNAFEQVKTDSQMGRVVVYGARKEEAEKAFNASLDNLSEVRETDIAELVRNNPNALQFHRTAERLLRRMKKNNTLEKINQYKESAARVGHLVYGNQWEYAMAYIDLEQQAQTPPFHAESLS